MGGFGVVGTRGTVGEPAIGGGIDGFDIGKGGLEPWGAGGEDGVIGFVELLLNSLTKSFMSIVLDF